MPGAITRRDLEMVSRIYDAAVDPDQWPQVLEQLIGKVDALGSAIFAADPNAEEFSIEAVTSIWTPERLGEYRSRFHAEESPQYRNLDRFPARRLLFDDQILEGICVARELPARKWFREEMGITHRAAARLQRENIWFDVVVFQYQLDGIEGDQSVLRKTDLYMDHLAKVIEVNRPFMILKKRYEAVLSVLDKYRVGVFVLNTRKNVVVRNSAADQILDSEGGLDLTERGRLSITDKSSEAEFDEAIGKAIGTAEAEDNRAETLMVVPRRAMGDSLLLDICPATDAGTELDRGFKGAFVFAVDPANLKNLSAKGMDVLYGITAAEMDVLDHLIRGFNIPETAESRGVTVETARGQAKSLLQKVGVRDKSQLIARVARVNLPID